MSNLSRKFNRNQARHKPQLTPHPSQNHGFWISNKEYAEEINAVKREAVAQSMMRVVLVTIYILWWHWGKLAERKTRLKNFYNLYIKYLEMIEELPTKEMEEAEKEMLKQTGFPVAPISRCPAEMAEPGLFRR